jgi:hypothetical protein
MQTTSEKHEVTSGGPSALGFARLFVIPAIALTLMLTLTLDSGPQPSARAARTLPSAPDPATARAWRQLDDAPYTLFMFSSSSAQPASMDEAQLIIGSFTGGGPHHVWYEWVNTPDEEAQILKAWEHANWIRSAEGLPAIRSSISGGFSLTSLVLPAALSLHIHRPGTGAHAHKRTCGMAGNYRQSGRPSRQDGRTVSADRRGSIRAHSPSPVELGQGR